MDRTDQALKNYVNTATELAESVKRNVVHDGIVDDETINKLNAFMIACNEVSFLTDELNKETNQLN